MARSSANNSANYMSTGSAALSGAAGDDGVLV